MWSERRKAGRTELRLQARRCCAYFDQVTAATPFSLSSIQSATDRRENVAVRLVRLGARHEVAHEP